MPVGWEGNLCPNWTPDSMAVNKESMEVMKVAEQAVSVLVEPLFAYEAMAW